MDIFPEIPGNKNYIDDYGNGSFTICGQSYEGPLIVSPDNILPWSIGNADAISKDDIELILSSIPLIEYLLIGSGASIPMLPKEVADILLQHGGVYFDFMETGAACRTYNVLMSEDRIVGAALIPIEKNRVSF